MKLFSRIITSVVLALALCLTPSAAGNKSTPPAIHPIVLDTAWSEAMDLCEGNHDWKMPHYYILVDKVVSPQEGWRLLGTYEPVYSLDKHGRIIVEEWIFVYITDYEVINDYDLFYEVVLHENLRSCWLRRVVSEPNFLREHPDSEKFVRDLLGQEVPSVYDAAQCGTEQ